ncbi:MAG: peptidase S41, partial [Sphingomonas sp.]
MSRVFRSVSILTITALLSACSGGGGGSGAATGVVAASAPTPTPTPTAAAVSCTLRDRQDWAAAQLREWYLFPETLPAALDPTPYATVDAYI